MGESLGPTIVDIKPANISTAGPNGNKPETAPTSQTGLPEISVQTDQASAGESTEVKPVEQTPEPIAANPEELSKIRSIIGDIPEDATVDSLMKILTRDYNWHDDAAPSVEAALKALEAEKQAQTEAEKMEGDTPDQAASGTATQVGDEDATQEDTEETQTEKESQAEPEVEEASDETEQPQEPEIPLSEKVDEAWKGKDGIVNLVTAAVAEGKFALHEKIELKDREEIAAELGISDPTDSRIYDEYEFRQNLHKALKDLKTEGKRNEDGSVSVQDEDGNIRLIKSEDCIEPILSAGKKLADETVTNTEGQKEPSERANKAQAALSVLEKVKTPHPDGGYYFDTHEEKKEPPEPPEKSLLRLRTIVNRALKFLSQPENMDSEDGKIAEAAIDAYGQLILVSETNISRDPNIEIPDLIMSAPPEVRLLLTRQALSTFQEFRRKVTQKGKKPEDSFGDWQEVQNEADKKNEGIDTTIDYLKKFVTENKKGKWDERIENLIKKGHLNEVVTSVFSASYFGKTKERRVILKQSKALREEGLVNEFADTKNPWIANFMEAFFGNLARQEEKKKILSEILGRLPLNKWKLATETVGGMLFVAALGKIDALMNEGMEPAQQGPGGPH